MLAQPTLTVLTGQQRDAEPISTEEDLPQSSSDPGVGSIFYGEPGKAAFYSLIVPGGGQVYNKRYWKVPIIWGIEGYAIYNLTQKISASRDATSCWRATLGEVDAENLSLCSAAVMGFDANSAAQQNEAFDERQSARTGKDVAWIIMSVAHLFNIVEAFVDRHLINFDTNEDLSHHNRPDPNMFNRSYLGSDVTFLRVNISLNR